MCGIAGVVMRSGAVSLDDLGAMAQTLRHRGPEDTGYYRSAGFGIAHTRLAIIDLAGGHQPIFDAERRYAIVCNGEIYNFVELRAELERLGRRFTTGSDSEVALQAFAAWGRDAFARLHGMYALALYDHLREELWLVRDRLAIKPLHYAQLPDRLLFASEIKALLPLMPAPAVNPVALAQYFQNQYSTAAECIVGGVTRVGAATALCVGADLQVRQHRYWSPLQLQRRRLGEAQAREEWEPLFDRVMREHLRADVPLGLFLSGGVDSAVLLAGLAERHPEPVRTFSIGYSDTASQDELDRAARIADLFGAQHTPIRLSREAVFSRLPRATWAADDLLRDTACLPTLALAEAAGRELKVVFSGEGGDEVFAGYARYRPALIGDLLKRWRHPGTGGFRVHGELSPQRAQRLFVPELQPALAAHAAPRIAAWAQAPRGWSALQRRQYTDLVTHLPDALLVKADRMLMSASLEGRVPFLDHRVVEFGLSLPDGLKLGRVRGRSTGKLFLKRWAQRHVPADHLWAAKRGFHVPIGRWSPRDFLRGLAERLPLSEGIRRWCRDDAVRALLAERVQRGSVSRELWGLTQFAIWHRLFIERPGAVPAMQEDPLEWL